MGTVKASKSWTWTWYFPELLISMGFAVECFGSQMNYGNFILFCQQHWAGVIIYNTTADHKLQYLKIFGPLLNYGSHQKTSWFLTCWANRQSPDLDWCTGIFKCTGGFKSYHLNPFDMGFPLYRALVQNELWNFTSLTCIVSVSMIFFVFCLQYFFLFDFVPVAFFSHVSFPLHPRVRPYAPCWAHLHWLRVHVGSHLSAPRSRSPPVVLALDAPGSCTSPWESACFRLLILFDDLPWFDVWTWFNIFGQISTQALISQIHVRHGIRLYVGWYCNVCFKTCGLSRCCWQNIQRDAKRCKEMQSVNPPQRNRDHSTMGTGRLISTLSNSCQIRSIIPSMVCPNRHSLKDLTADLLEKHLDLSWFLRLESHWKPIRLNRQDRLLHQKAIQKSWALPVFSHRKPIRFPWFSMVDENAPRT